SPRVIQNQTSTIMATTEASPITGFDQPAFEAFLAQRNEPDWIQEQRREAFAHYQRMLAARLDPEEFRRIDLRTFRPQDYSLRSAGPGGSRQQDAQDSASSQLTTLMQGRADFAGSVIHEDGSCVRSVLSDDLSKQGVLFGDLGTLLPQYRDVLEPYFLTRAVQADTDRFSAWHAAFWTGGTVLYVPRNVEIKTPLYSLIRLAQANATDLSHTLVILEDGASATLLEETSSAD